MILVLVRWECELRHLLLIIHVRHGVTIPGQKISGILGVYFFPHTAQMYERVEWRKNLQQKIEAEVMRIISQLLSYVDNRSSIMPFSMPSEKTMRRR